ncbi:Uncharacterised protein [Mycobacteroides abscessus subsp. abscessus]|nr:Uncharacterised protein [Mycobacteroides abscessus subsp. abscessus]
MSSPMSSSRDRNFAFAFARLVAKVTALLLGCDQMGWRARAAARLRGTQVRNQVPNSSLFESPYSAA